MWQEQHHRAFKNWFCSKRIKLLLRQAVQYVRQLTAILAHTGITYYAAREVLGKRLCAKKPCISQATLANIDQCRQAIQRGDVEEYRCLAGPWRRSPRHDKQ